MPKKAHLVLYISLLYFLFPKAAHAYLDPGTGSYVFQIVIAGLLGSMFFIKSAVKKLKNMYKNIFRPKVSVEVDGNT